MHKGSKEAKKSHKYALGIQAIRCSGQIKTEGKGSEIGGDDTKEGAFPTRIRVFTVNMSYGLGFRPRGQRKSYHPCLYIGAQGEAAKKEERFLTDSFHSCLRVENESNSPASGVQHLPERGRFARIFPRL